MQNLYMDKFGHVVLTMYPVRSNLIDLVSQVLATIRNQRYFLHRGVSSFLGGEHVEEISGETIDCLSYRGVFCFDEVETYDARKKF